MREGFASQKGRTKLALHVSNSSAFSIIQPGHFSSDTTYDCRYITEREDTLRQLRCRLPLARGCTFLKVGGCSLLSLHHDLCISLLSRGSPDCTCVVRLPAATPSKKPGHHQYRNLITTWSAGQMYLDTHVSYISQPSPSVYTTCIAYRWT